MKMIDVVFVQSDGEVVMSGDNVLLDLLTFTSPHRPGGGGEEALPTGSRRYVLQRMTA